MTEAKPSDTVRKSFFSLTPTIEILEDLHAHTCLSKQSNLKLHVAFLFVMFSKLCIIILILLMKD